MSIETKHAEKLALYQMLLVRNGNQSINQAIRAIKAVMEPEDAELVEKQFADMLNEKED